MNPLAIRRALIAVHDKRGVVELARALSDEFGVEIVSTGGTARHLSAAGVRVTPVEAVTGVPEMLDGRVKTLHPHVHAGILADRDNAEHMRQLGERGIAPIDAVIVNLYPFERTVADPSCRFDDAIEMIDIGGPCLLRAAAKNHQHVLVVCSPDDYGDVLAALRAADRAGLDALRRRLAERAFAHTAAYDAAVSGWLSGDGPRCLPLEPAGPPPRYGENPHQQAELLRAPPAYGPDLVSAERIDGGAAMSYNNFADADAALRLCAELCRSGTPGSGGEHPVCVFVKHANPCGVGVADSPLEAYRRAYLGDPNAAMGGILACGFKVDAESARCVMETYDRFGKAAGAGGFFVEVWLAPSFDADAVEIVRTTRKWGENVRLLAVGDMRRPPDPRAREFRSISGGMLAQSVDTALPDETRWSVATRRAPTAAERADLRLAWLIAKHTRSNAISVVRDGMLIGNGAGQMSRVMSCRIATWLAGQNGHAERLRGAAAGSDAFFPFQDGPELLMEAGVTAIIQPGGSKRDAEVVAACDQRDVAMIFTGTRHFRH